MPAISLTFLERVKLGPAIRQKAAGINAHVLLFVMCKYDPDPGDIEMAVHNPWPVLSIYHQLAILIKRPEIFQIRRRIGANAGDVEGGLRDFVFFERGFFFV